MEIAYKVTIKFPNGSTRVRTYNIDKPTLPYLIMRLKSQYRMSEIDWEGANGDYGTTEIKRP
jgi:hypothetical protein